MGLRDEAPLEDWGVAIWLSPEKGAVSAPRVDRLVADRVALGVGRIVNRSHCATCLHAQASADLAGCAPLRQIGNHAAEKDLITVQRRSLGRCLAVRSPGGRLGPIRPVGARVKSYLMAHR